MKPVARLIGDIREVAEQMLFIDGHIIFICIFIL